MPESRLNPRLTALLDSLRGRVRRYLLWDSLLAIAVVVLSAFWIGLALDYLPVLVGGTEMPRLARALLLVVVAVLIIGIIVTLLIGRMSRELPDDSLALLVERHHPQLGGRLVTAVQLNQPGRSGDTHSPALLQKVHDEAARVVDEVDPSRVFRWQPLVRKALIAGPLALMTLVLLLVSPNAFGRAASRLSLLSDDPWPRRAELEMVGVELPKVSVTDDDTETPDLIEFVDNVVRLPKGSNGTLRIRAKADDAEVPVVCTVYYWGDDGTQGQSNMRRVGRQKDGYQSFLLDGPPFAGLSESMTISVRGLDDRLDDYRIEAVEPPGITEMKVLVRYPEYLRAEGTGDVDLETTFQSGLRIREGSDLTLIANCSRPLGDAEVLLKSDTSEIRPAGIEYAPDRMSMRLTIPNFSSATTVRIVPRDPDGISAQSPYRYFLGVVLDEPPEMQLTLDGIGSAVTPIARIPMKAVAKDDYGVANLELSVSIANSETEEPPTASVSPKLDRDGNAEAVLDLRDLVNDGNLPAIEPGGAINVFGEATDRYNLDGTHLTRSEVNRLQVVTPEQILALMERRELALRSILEQSINETRNLRDTLDLLRRRSFEGDDSALEPDELTRQIQVRGLRVQQAGLQASKTSEELSGIAASLQDLLQEMINNRVDSVDRRERIGTGVRDPIVQIVDGPLKRLQAEIKDIEGSVSEPEVAAMKTATAVATAEDVLLQLAAVLEKMLDIESFNEILDRVRDLIDDQEDLLDETKEERKKELRKLFE